MLRLSAAEFMSAAEVLLQDISREASRLGIVVVANVQNRTKTSSDYASQSVISEFFSDQEVQEVLADLRSAGVFVTPFYDEREFMSWILADGHRHIPAERIVVYNAAQNGTGPGRKSLIPSFCGLHGIPTTGSDAYVVSLCRHKYHLNRLLRASGYSVPNSWWYFGDGRWAQNERPSLGTHVIFKLTYESASLGLDSTSTANWNANFEDKAQALVEMYRQPILVQQFISGREMECPVVRIGKDVWCDCVGILTKDGLELGSSFLTYDMVFNDGYGFVSRSPLSHEDTILCDQAASIAETIGIRGIGRIDYRMSDDGTPFIIDIATNPHLVHHSSVAFSLRKVAPAIKPFLLLVALKLKDVQTL